MRKINLEKVYSKKNEKLTLCSPGKLSFFDLINTHCGKDNNNNPLHRLCTLIRKMRGQSVLIEELVLNQELKDELAMAQKRLKNNKINLKATRLTFFLTFPSSGNWQDVKELPDDHILGYAVIVSINDNINYKKSYVLEAVLRPPSILFPVSKEDQDRLGISVFIWPTTNCYVHNTRKFHTNIGTKTKTREFSFVGSFFAQQNNLTHVCAHAALRTAINSSPEFGEVKLTNKKINDILGIDFSTPEKTVGSLPGDPKETKEGLSSKEIGKVAASLGGTVDVANFYEKIDIEYDQYIYPSLESGYPVILGIEGYDARGGQQMAHAVAVLGHTLDSDRWSPQARGGYGSFPIQPYIPVTSWCDHYVVSDDNFGMFVTLPSDMIRNFLIPSKNPHLHASMAVTILPKNVNLTGYVAEEVAVSFAKAMIDLTKVEPMPKWLKLLQERSGQLICRTLLCKAKEYREHLKMIAAEKGLKIEPDHQKKINSLRGYVWVSEISIPNIYDGNKHKLGDVVIKANASKKDHAKSKSVFMAWFPGIVFFVKHDLFEVWHISDHVPFLRHETQSFLEW